MLAIKECLIREGVLNPNPTNLSTNTSVFSNPAAQNDVNTPYNTLYSNRYSFGSNLNMLNNLPTKSATDVSVNDLSSANSATAKTSCQQQQPQSAQQESSAKPQSRKLPKRYQGHHPHFHHHTAPAYYTDLHLKIHTPEAKDSVNENYRSVYRTPSKLIKDEHQFPRTKTATLPAPLALSPRQKLPNETDCLENQGSFFRGGTSHSDQRQPNCKDPCMPSNKKLPKPTKGNSSSPSDFIVNDCNSNLPLAAPVQSADGSVVFACTNFKHCHTVENKSPIQNITGRSRNTQRFANRKRAVRVRSESRPISALYDIICKEKGLDIATTTTNDEDSSDSHTHNGEKAQQTSHTSKPRRSHSRSVSRQTKSSMASSTNSNMSGCLENNSTGGDRKQHKTALPQQRNDKYLKNSIFINDLSDDNDDQIYRLEGGGLHKNFLMSNLHTQANLWEELQQSKSSSLPPGLLDLEKPHQRSVSYHNSHDPFSKISNIENNKKESLDSSSGSKSLLSSKANHTCASAAQQTTSTNPPLSSNITLSVEHTHMHLSIKSLHEQPHTGTGTDTTNPTTTSNQSQLQDQLKQQQSKADRNSRKYRRLHDEKPRRHTDGAIKFFSPTKNDLDGDGLPHNNDANDHHQNLDVDIYSDDGDDDDQHHHISQFHDLNGTSHDFHTSSGTSAAYAKRYITRSQRIQQQQQQQQQQQTNNSRSSPLVANNPALNAALKQELNPSTNSETTTSTTTTKVESNGHTTETNSEDKEEPEQEMTNNSGKNSKTTTTATATATATKTTNKELKFKIPLKKEVTSSACATTATAPAPAPAAAVPDALCSSTTASSSAYSEMSVLHHKLMEQPHHHHHMKLHAPLQQPHIANKLNSINFNNNLNPNNIDTNHNNCNNNYTNPTASSVLKQRHQNCAAASITTSILSPSKYRKCPLSPLMITTNALLLSTTTLTSPSQQLVSMTQPQPQTQQQHTVKPLPVSPIRGVTLSPLSPNTSPTCSSSVHLVRTTKTTRLRAAALDKKKDEEKLQQQRFTSPTSPKPKHYSQHNRRASPSSNNSDNMKLATSSSEAERNHKMSSDNSSPTHRGNKKLVPSVSILMKQNLSETQCTASRPNTISPKSPKQQLQNNNTEYTIKTSASANVKTISNNICDFDDDFLEINDLPVSPLNNNDTSVAIRPRCSTMITDANASKISFSNSDQNNLELSPVNTSRSSNRSPRRCEERDKSSKRKSNLNRSLNEEATLDGDDNAMRRRRRREMGMSRPLVPNDDADLKALLSPHKSRLPSPPKPTIRNDLSYHMEMARRGLDLATTSDRRRAQAASPKTQKENTSPKSSIPISRTGKRCDAVTMGELRKQRSSEVNRKLNERTRTGLEEIMKIVENVSDSSPNPSNAITDLTQTMKRLRASQESEIEADDLHLLCTNTQEQRRPSPVKHATFLQEERIYYEPDPLEHIETNNGDGEHLNVSTLRSLRMLKSKSIERETPAYEPAVLSPILRRKSTDCPSTLLAQGAVGSATPNHIVSILKKKDHLSTGESSSASSNASPVTFSSSVMDTPSKQKRAGILKKRSSLDESRYYSRSHSPDERSILIKSARRNSLEEVANGSSSSSSAQGAAGRHGILKQSSYDSCKSEGCPSANREPHQPHSILKKKDSTSTPSDGGDHAPKHVSISQAVILAAAELSAANGTGDKFSNDDINYTPNNEELDIKPILKLDYSGGDESVKPPKPILKKKSSGDSDEQEIKPILKTSRKSSREEFEFGTYSDCEGQQEPQVKPILKTDSPSKRLSLGDPDSSQTYQEGSQRETLLKRRTRSLERHDQAPVIDLAAALNAIATSQALPSELVSSLTISTASSNISVSERIKSVEKFLANQSGLRSSPTENPLTTSSFTSAVNTSWEPPLHSDSNSLSNAAGGVKVLKPSVIRRDLYKDRYKTQPVTSDEKNFFKNDVSSLSDNLPSGSAFNPAQSLEGLGFSNLSSHGYQSSTAAPSAFTLTRSFTQPLSSSVNTQIQPASSLRLGVPVPLPRKSPLRSSLPCSQDTANLSASFTSESSYSCHNNSENVFKMSNLEQDVSMSENQEPKASLNKDPCETSETSAGVVRTNSVKARANMFQQLEESTKKAAVLNRDERTSPKRVPRRLSPSPAIADEPKTPNNPDDEIEPSSLPLSERLRFFSSLSEASKRNSYSFNCSTPFDGIERCSSISSYHFYKATTTPRSSTTLSSPSVTPTPMECCSPLLVESPTMSRKDSAALTLPSEFSMASAEAAHDLTDSRFLIKSDIVKTSPFLQASKQQPQAVPVHVADTQVTPTSILTPTMKRIKLKAIGKLLMPSTFLSNDRNNNNKSAESSINKEVYASTDSSGDNETPGPPKKIGKIKSPFIENCKQKQQKQIQNNAKSMKFDYNNKSLNSMTALTSLENSAEHHSMDLSANNMNISISGALSQRKYQNDSLQTNGHYCNEDFSTDSGKENVDTSHKGPTTPVIEIRRKFTRKANTSQSFNNSTGSGVLRQLTPNRSTSLNGPYSTPQIDDKYAKYLNYFGVATSAQSTKISQSKQNQTKPSSAGLNHFGQQKEKFTQPQTLAINGNDSLCGSYSREMKQTVSVARELKYEDIIVSEEEPKSTERDFNNLLLSYSILEDPSEEFERIFSSTV